MSDTRAKYPPIFNLDATCAFVSDEGRVVGMASVDDGVVTGLCLALLDEPVTITDWMEMLNITQDPLEASEALLEELGGVALRRFVRLDDATFLFPNAVAEPGEA